MTDMTVEQSLRFKSQLERLKELEKQLIAIPDDVGKTEFPDLIAEMDEFIDVDTDDNAEFVIANTTKRIQFYEKYIARCKEYMEQQNDR